MDARHGILVLEPDAGAARLQQKHLERAGYSVACAGSPDEALKHLQDGKTELLFLDYQIPGGINGLEFYGQLKASGHDLPVILLTDSAEEVVLLKALRAGVRDCIRKTSGYLSFLPPAAERVLKQVLPPVQLMESHARLGGIIETAMDAIIAVEVDGRISLFNPAAERMFGCKAADAMGRHIHRFLPKEFASGERDGDSGSSVSPISLSLSVPSQIRGLRANGEEFPLEASLSRFEVAGRRFYTIMVRDITERLRAEEALRRTHDELEIQVRERTAELARANQELSDFIENAPLGLHWAGPDGTILWANRAEAELLGYTQAECIGYPISTFHADPKAAEDILQRLSRNETLSNYEARLVCKNGAIKHVLIDANAFWGVDRFVHARCFMRDITERKRAEEQMKSALREKEVLLKEVEHRVKNNLQVVSSLLSLQSRKLDDPKALALIKESQGRIQAMAIIHEKLYRSKDLARINFADYIQSLALSLVRSYVLDPSRVALKTEVEGLFFGVDTAIPCGLIINELVSNSLKHAFPAERNGEVRIGLRSLGDGRFILSVTDNGVGLPADFAIRKASSLGLQLVSTLIDQLAGALEIGNSGGTSFEITFQEAFSKQSV